MCSPAVAHATRPAALRRLPWHDLWDVRDRESGADVTITFDRTARLVVGVHVAVGGEAVPGLTPDEAPPMALVGPAEAYRWVKFRLRTRRRLGLLRLDTLARPGGEVPSPVAAR